MKDRKNAISSSRHLELLKKYYQVDEANKVIILDCHFEKCSDVLMTDFTNKKHPLFKNEILDNINEQIKDLPFGYKIKIHLHFDDYEDYSYESILDAFNDALELNQYSYRKNDRIRFLKAGILLLVGIFFMMLMVFSNQYGWFGTGVSNDILVEIIDIAAWVFIWEAVYMIFLENTGISSLNVKLRSRVNSITLFNKDEFIKEETINELFKNWEDESKIKKFGKLALLFSSVAMIATCFSKAFLINYIVTLEELDVASKTVLIVSDIIALIVQAIAGIAGLFKYIGRDNKIAKFVQPYSILIIISLIVSLTLSIIYQNPHMILTNSSAILIDILYIAGCFIDKYQSKNSKTI